MPRFIGEVRSFLLVGACVSGVLVGLPTEAPASLPMKKPHFAATSLLPRQVLAHEIGALASVATTIPLSLTRLNDVDYRLGDPLPPEQQLRLTSGEYSVKYTAFTTQDWLTVRPREGMTPQDLTVGFNPSSLPPGRYLGSVVVDAPQSTDQRASAVANLFVRTSFTVSPASLIFRYWPTGVQPPSQTLSLQSRAASVDFEISKGAASGWLSVSPVRGSTPATVTVSVTPGALSPGAYNTSIYVSASNTVEGTRSVPVQLVVSPAPPPRLVLGKTDLLFDVQVGGVPVAPQSVGVASSDEPISFSASASTDSGGAWLAVSPMSGLTPANLAVTVNPSGLAEGKYTGTISISSPDALNSPQIIRVTLTLALPKPRITAIVNAASFLGGPVAPGELVVIFGSGLGPQALTSLQLGLDGRVSSTLENTRVLFDGQAAPLLYVSASQTAAVVPFWTYGRASVALAVEHHGWVSSPVELRVADTAPGIFTVDSSGRGQGAVLNEDSALNSPANPAPRRSVAILYATGAGQTEPPGVDGGVTHTVLATPLSPVALTVGGVPAEVLYAGGAPGCVAGVIQVNFVVPADAPTGDAVPVVLTAGGNKSQASVTMAVR